jgi:peptidoglycan/xylan/chitin deacetylase (PgdA/CDA1 family)
VAEVVNGDAAGHSVAITFDDGYADNVDNAMPVLTKYSVPATFFITSGTLDSGIMWNDRLLHAIRETPNQHVDLGRLGLGRLQLTRDGSRSDAFKRLIQNLKYRDAVERNELVAAVEEAAAAPPPPRLMMTRQQARELAGEPLADIGGHTVSHPILARLPDREAEREIAGGKETLEALIGRRIRCFAYPNGIPDSDYSATHVRMVRNAGFELAVSTSVGGFGPRNDVYQVPRIKPWDRRPVTFGMRMLMASRLDAKCVAVCEPDSST